MPSIGRKKTGEYVKTWQMEPLVIALLAGLTPPGIKRQFFDDRIENIDFDEPTDLAAISVETYTAKRAYQIAGHYRNKGVKVVLGGFHPTLMPQEAKLHADAVVIGEAELVWQQVLDDAISGRLKQFYQGAGRPTLEELWPDRSIYSGKRYLKLALIESARGCRFNCSFCSISAFYKQTYRPRPVEDVVREIKRINAGNVFFIDDNIAADISRANALFQKLAPLGIKWISQISIQALKDKELVGLMAKSGCMGVLVGLESLNQDNLLQMNKTWNGEPYDYMTVLAGMRKRGIAAYPTFIFGYDGDTLDSFKRTLDFAVKEGFFFIAFNHLVPFPGTALYESLRNDGRLLYDSWWLNEKYTFGDVAFKPVNFSPGELSRLCFDFRKRFYGYPSILKRAFNFRGNCNGLSKCFAFFSLNVLARKEIRQRQGLPLGNIWK